MLRTDLVARHVLLACALVSLFVVQAESHTSDFVIPVFEIPSSSLPDLFDGTLEDWEAVLPNASMDQTFFSGIEIGQQVSDPGSIAFRVFLAWHFASQRILVGVEVADDRFVSDAIADGISIMVDGDHSGGLFGPIAQPEEVFQAQIINVGFSDRIPVAPSPFLSPRLSAVEGQGDVLGEVPSVITVEVSFAPFDEFPIDNSGEGKRSRLAPGRFIGFNMSVHDVDEANSGTVARGGSRSYALAPAYYTAPSIDGWQTNASNFADAELLSCSVEDCSMSASTSVSSTSWGRIKASFGRDNGSH
jgi:hypothetical protein